MIHLFIDTNRYLSLFGLKQDTLEEFKKLIKYISDKKITLWLPEQVKNEFERNLEPEIIFKKYKSECDKIDRIIPIKVNYSNIPNIQEYEMELNEVNKHYEYLTKIHNEISNISNTIKKKIISKVKEDCLVPKKIIDELFALAKFIPYEESLIKKAFTRKRLRIPPCGKDEHYGDVVIWEVLLKEVPTGEDLHFVGFDDDFMSKIDNKEFSTFLAKEWKEKKKSKIIAYKHLGDFTKKMIPEIENPDKITEQEIKSDKDYLLSGEALREQFLRVKSFEVIKEAMSHVYFPIEKIKEMFGVLPTESFRKAIEMEINALEPFRKVMEEERKRMEQWNEAMNKTMSPMIEEVKKFKEAMDSIPHYKDLLGSIRTNKKKE